MVAGDVRRSTEDLQPAGLDHIQQVIEDAPDGRGRCLIALLFLSGRRINEILGLRRRDLKFSGVFLSFTIRLLKVPGNPEVVIRIGLRSPITKRFLPYVTEHLDRLDPGSYVFGSKTHGGHITDARAYQIIRYETGHDEVWPHWFRHQRFTQISDDMIESGEIDPRFLHDFSKHRRYESTLEYIHSSKRREQAQKY